ncbi:Galanin receptor type 1 [Nibea albiflora]|uniref:Galanin receptor type 1 n=1 Tax=Nibea albiflora TaxID=240163 RepID=A0ACB7ET18_NIBAL|nr:Galanin receptor type 1 [Nibea albiflora]
MKLPANHILEVGVDNFISLMIFGLIFILGVLGNTMVITVLARSKPGQPRSTTNIFILNLSVADLSYLLFCVPFQSTIYMLSSWVLGAFICKFIHYFFTVSMLVSIFTLSAMSVDRYVAIVHARKSSSIRVGRHAMIGVVLIWIVSLVMAATRGALPEHRGMEGQQHLLLGGLAGPPEESLRDVHLCFRIPAASHFDICLLCKGGCAWITVLNHLHKKLKNVSRKSELSKKKTAQTVLVVVVVFCLSWLPHHIVHLWVEFGSFPLSQASFVFRVVAHCLAYSNSSVNPIIYAFLSENFRNSYKQVFWCRMPSKCPVNDTRDLRSRVETAPSTNISVTYKGHDSQISKML